MKRLLLLTLITLFSLPSFAAKIISTCDQLLDIKNRTTENYVLNQDIDCIGYTQSKSVDFKGELDGSGYSIIGLDIKYNDKYVGLFSRVITGKVINLGLNSMTVTLQAGSNSVGILAGNVGYGSLISGVRVIDSSIRTTESVSFGLGLLVGYVSNQSNLESVSSYNSQIESSDLAKHIGGLVGVLDKSSLNSASLDLTHIGISQYLGGKVSIGGVVGKLNESIVSGATIENSSIIANSIQRGYGSTFIGQMVQSRLVNSVSINNTVQLGDHNDQWNPALVAGYIHQPLQDITTLENITTSSKSNYKWYNFDDDAIVLTDKLFKI